MNLDKTGILARHFDSVVMLTWSNWKTEPRSNRYHYASRFAQHLPVIFVQPDLVKPEVIFENTQIDNLVVLHVYATYGREQTALINKALVEKGLIHPLLWVYNIYFSDFIAQRYSPLLVYHATEDYFSPDVNSFNELHEPLRNLLKHVDLLVAVSEEVLLSYKKNGLYSGRSLLLENGCDFSFWAPTSTELERLTTQKPPKKIAFYQGGINSRLDIQMLTGICKEMPDWEIWLCGAVAPGFDQKTINPEQLPNLKNFGFLDIEKVRDLAYQSTVGIIPFVQNEMIRVSLPLKAFEYVACGLPVVSVPIPALEKYPDIFTFAVNPRDFSQAIIQAAKTRHDDECMKKRLKAAREQDYDARFAVLLDEINAIMASPKRTNAQFNILVLYDANSIRVNTIKEHLVSFSRYLKSNVFYVSATNQAICTIDLSIFDVIVIHYCVRVSMERHLSPSYAEAVSRFGGYKILFIQDEYDTTEIARRWIERLGIHALFTCVPVKYIDEVYPQSRFPHLERIQTLTGFVPIGIEERSCRPISERQITIGYRGRPLPFHYGDLGQEKVVIARRMKQICRERNIVEDIEWSDEKRIYGDRWYEFVESCRATLGTESGSNVFDDDGEIKRNVERALAENPALPYEEIHARYIGDREGKIKVNQISPRIFEAIALRTALVLFEGDYSGVIQPTVHYIPLRKDFSNIEDVLVKLADDNYLTQLTERAYQDIILSKRYSYERFVEDFDSFLSKKVVKRNAYAPLMGLLVQQLPRRISQLEALSRPSIVSMSPLTNMEINTLNIHISAVKLGDVIKVIVMWARRVFAFIPRNIKNYRIRVRMTFQKYFSRTDTD